MLALRQAPVDRPSGHSRDDEDDEGEGLRIDTPIQVHLGSPQPACQLPCHSFATEEDAGQMPSVALLERPAVKANSYTVNAYRRVLRTFVSSC